MLLDKTWLNVLCTKFTMSVDLSVGKTVVGKTVLHCIVPCLCMPPQKQFQMDDSFILLNNEYCEHEGYGGIEIEH